MPDKVEQTGLLSAAAKLSERWTPAEDGETVDENEEVVDSTDTDENGDEETSETTEDEDEETGKDEEENEEPDVDDETEQTSDDDGTAWADLSEVLSAAEVDPKNLPVTIKSNGEDVKTNLHEALQGYQRGVDYERRREELDSERDDFEVDKQSQLDRLQTAAQSLVQVSSVVDEMAKADEELIHQQYATVDWAALRTSDPAEWSIRRNDYQEALNANLQKSQDVGAKISGAVKKAAENITEIKKTYQADQLKKLVKLNPTWKSEKVALKEGKKITDYLRTAYKASDKEITNMVDHRSVDMARKAMLYDELVEKGNGKITQIPKPGKKTKGKKLLKPGSGGVSRSLRPGGKSSTTARDRLRKSHNQKDATDALSERWNTK